jgi:GNAT superfamily N-acetyltransferase
VDNFAHAASPFPRGSLTDFTVRPLTGLASLGGRNQFTVRPRPSSPALANLRIRIFRVFPYLYDGDLAYEEKYLARFKAADRAFLAAAFDGDRIVGAATAAPMAGETDRVPRAVRAAGYDVSKVFYFAESLLLPEYRGHGVGHRFFDAREAHARSFGEYGVCHVLLGGAAGRSCGAACGLPAARCVLDKRGYPEADGLTTSYAWKDVGDSDETEKTMQFWMKRL